MEPKTLIDEASIQKLAKQNNAGYLVMVIVLLFAAVAAVLTIPSPILGVIVAAIMVLVMTAVIKDRKKAGPLKVYFIKRPMTQKFIATESTSEGDQVEAYYVAFGDQKKAVFIGTFQEAVEGGMYYVMYNANDNRIVRFYEVDKYDLDPSLDIREL
ncbi:MAG: hypothetical protein E7474_14460 [Ruminococcaceae bacterium]|nr:hypothetical protein [Oscillospiraceae bacterium]